MKSALGAIVCVATVYAGCSWFVAHGLDDSHLEAAANNGGWIAVSEPTLKSPHQFARRPEAMIVDSEEAGLSPEQYDDAEHRGALPCLAQSREFDPSSL